MTNDVKIVCGDLIVVIGSSQIKAVVPYAIDQEQVQYKYVIRFYSIYGNHRGYASEHTTGVGIMVDYAKRADIYIKFRIVQMRDNVNT